MLFVVIGLLAHCPFSCVLAIKKPPIRMGDFVVPPTAGSNQIKGDLEAILNFNSSINFKDHYYFLLQYGRLGYHKI